jgi:catechol 2,3-dioxygenase-like lactoylglutathione lyase family enzyme
VLEAAELAAFVPSGDLARSRELYAATLGLTHTETGPFACVLRSGRTTRRVTRVDDLRPQPFTVLGWVVDDIAAAVAGLTARGVTFHRYPGMDQDELGVWTAPGGARIAWFPDPDGNVLSLTQHP